MIYIRARIVDAEHIVALHPDDAAQLIDRAFVGARNDIIRIERRELTAGDLPPETYPLVDILRAAEAVRRGACQKLRLRIPDLLKGAFPVGCRSVKIPEAGKIVRKQLLNGLCSNVVLPAIGAVGIFSAELPHLRTLVKVRVDHAEIVDRCMLPDADLADQLNGVFSAVGTGQPIPETLFPAWV